jgi:uncharacterized protein YcgI (DUF1989 family)
MKKLQEAHVPYNTGWAGELKKGQVIRIIATTTVDFVCMRLENLKERFDQARTKVYNMKIFITTGDKLMGRNNQHMMTIVDNTNREGTHDLQKGMCSGYRFQLAKKEGKLRDYYHRDYQDRRDSRSRFATKIFRGLWRRTASLRKTFPIRSISIST